MVNRDKEKLKRLWQDILSDVKKVSSTNSAALDEYGYVQKQLRLNASGGKTHLAVVISGSKIWITVRERQVLFGLCCGLSAIEISQCVQLSHRTVEYYTSNLKAKFHVFSRQALIDLVISRTTFLNECRELDKELCRDEIESV